MAGEVERRKSMTCGAKLIEKDYVGLFMKHISQQEGGKMRVSLRQIFAGSEEI